MNREPIKILQSLIKIDSQNPPGNERKIVSFIERYLKDIKASYKIYEFKKNRQNLVCILKSKNSKKKILITPHLDTVPATGRWQFPPFSGKIYNKKIYGRGATDCKVNVAAALYLIKRLKEKLENIDLIFAFCADEETGSFYGIIPILKILKNIDYGIVLDSDEFDIIIAQKGLLHLRVEIFGKEAHGAYPERGINAIEKAIKILDKILRYKFRYKKDILLKKPTINIGRLIGGDKVNVVAGYCFFELDIRYLASMDKNYIIKIIESIIKRYKIKYRIKILAHQEPIRIDKNLFLIKILKKILLKHNIKPRLKASFGATVLNFLEDKGIKSFSFGFGSRGTAHTKDEYVKVDNLYKGIEVLEDYIINLDRYFQTT